jgi:hypothetical protein
MIEFYGAFCDIDEISIGIFMGYGDDNSRYFHQIVFGFIFFELTIRKYYEA